MRIAILGGGESGVGAAVLAKKQGFEVFYPIIGINLNTKPCWINMKYNGKKSSIRRKNSERNRSY